MEGRRLDPAEKQGQLERKLRAGRFAITAEVTPPLSSDPKDLLEKALPLKGLVDAVNVTDGASARAHMSALAAAALLVQAGIEPILQLTCRDRNRIALQSDILGAAAMGVRNLLILSGDDPSAGDQPETKPVFDLNSRSLVRTAALIRDKAILPSGREIASRTPLFIGAADMPIDPPRDWKPTALKEKILAGAQFVQTQFCMDGDILRRYIARLAEEGIVPGLFILVGVAPLASVRSALWIRSHLFGAIVPDRIVARMEQASDQREEGKRICIELLQELSETKGVAGAHLMAPLNDAAIPEVISESGLLAKAR